MEYKDFFSPKTLEKLNTKSAENLKTMLGDKSLMQTIMSSNTLMSQISKAEEPYKTQLENLAIEMVKELYPIIDEEGITLDAKIASISDIGKGLDESITPESRRRIINAITQGAALRGAFAFYLFKEHLDDLDPTLVEKYNQIMKNSFGIYDDENAIAMMLAALAQGQKMAGGSSKVIINEIKITNPSSPKQKIFANIKSIYPEATLSDQSNQYYDFIIYLFGDTGGPMNRNTILSYSYEDPKTYVVALGDDIYGRRFKIVDNLIKYVKNNPIKQDTNEIKVNEAESKITIQARAANFPMLIHELIKGLYELLSLQGFKGDKAANQAVVDKVDLLKNEPSDIRYGKFIFDALNKVFINSEYTDPRIREFFLTEVYQLGDEEFIQFIENAVNDELTQTQNQWANNTLRDIASDLKSDDYESTGLDEIKINTPGSKKLIINQSHPGFGYIHFKNNTWIDKNLFDKWTSSSDTIYTNPYKNYAYVSLFDLNENDLNEFKQYLASKGIPSQIVIWYNLPRLKIDRKYYDLKNLYNNDLNEIKINTPMPLGYLLNLQSKFESTEDPKEKLSLAVQCAEKVLFIWKKEHPNDDRPRKAIEAAKAYLANPTEENKKVADDTSNDAHTAAVYDKSDAAGAAYAIAYATRAASGEIYVDRTAHDKLSFVYAIRAIKEYYNLNEIKLQPLNEYSEKTINTTIERWKATDPETDENTAKQLIQRFDQIKSGLASKLNVVSLSDTLKQGQNYLNIDKYSFEDMVKLIKSLPENPEKIKKDAVTNFVQRDKIDKATAQSYVARFISKRDELKYAVENGMEDGSLTKEEVRNFIPKKLLSNNAYLDPRVWSWGAFEQMLDALFPSQKAAGEEGENLVSTDADKIYDKGGIEIYKGDDVHKCISYNPTSAETKRKKYGWCVTVVGNTNYDYYRFGGGKLKSPTFYFVFDRSKTSSPEHATFDDEWHAFVIQVEQDQSKYIVTGANNRGDITADSWEDISKIVSSETWAKIKGLKDYFKPINLSAVERGRKFASGKNLSVNEFKELSQDEKILYIQGKASKNEISKDILEILPQYKINLEGRSTTLANIAIDSGQTFPYSALKNNEALAKRYAIFRFRHTNYSKNPIPLPYVKYLDEDAKQKYLDTFDDNLTFEYIEKYFGQNATEKYVDEQVKKLDYLPQSAIKYIKNPKLKTLFGIYSKLFNSWEFGNNTNLSDEALESAQNMPEQDVNPIPINLKQWLELSPQEQKIIIELTEKYNQNPDYSTLAYASPFIIKDGAETYKLLPGKSDNYNYTDWVLLDKNNNIVKKLPEGTLLGDLDLISGYPSPEDNFKRVWNLKDLKIEK